MSYIPQSLQGRLVLLIALIALPGFLLLWFEASEDRGQAIESAKLKALQSLEILSGHENELLARTERYLKRLASFSPTHNPTSKQCTALLRQAIQLTDTYYNLGVPSPDGELNCNALPLKRKVNVADRPYIQKALETRQFSIGKYQIDRAAGVSSVNFAYPVITPNDNKIVGIAVAVVSLDWWSDRLAEIELPEQSIVFISDTSGQILAIHPKDQSLIGKTADALNMNTESLEASDQRIISIMTDQSGVTRIFARNKLSSSNRESPLTFSVGVPFGQQLIRIEQQYIRDGLLLLSIFLVLLMAALWAARKGILNPINAFAQSIEKIDLTASEIPPLKQGIKELLQLNNLFVSNINKRLNAERNLAQQNERFELAMKGANDGLFDWNLKDNTIYYSPRWKSMLGYEDHELPNDFSIWEDLVEEKDRERSWAMLSDYIDHKRDNFHLEFRMKHKDGNWVDILSRAFLVRDSEGEALRAVGTHVDISEKKRQEALLQQDAAVFEHTIEGVIITDPEGKIINANRAFEYITGYSKNEVIGRNPNLLKSGRQDKSFYRALWESLKKRGYWRGEIWNRRKDGTVFPEWTTISSVTNDNGEVVNYISVFSDISDIKRKEEKLQHLADHDILTDLPNRLMFNHLLDQALSEARRNKSRIAVIFIDLDRFKNINDSMGHKAGDELLKIIAHRFQANVRRQDVVSRIGGDEFIILFKDIGSINSVTGTINQIMSAFEKPIELEGQQIHITASIGVSLYPDNGETAVTLIKNADAAMYRAKDEGRNTFQFYSREMTSIAFERVVMENSIRKSLDQGDFYLVYQPQIMMDTGMICGIEALIRWNHPDMGVVTPSRFIPIAEESGLIHEIGLWVLKTACAQAQQWRNKKFYFGQIAVNISGLQLTRKSFFRKVESIIKNCGIDPALLELEITEGYFMLDIDQSIEQLESLRNLGISLSIDDFGTGYSSLSYLKSLPVKKLKIDQSFVRDIATDANDLAIVDAIIAMGHALGMSVIAEGVENQHQAELLRDHGCLISQGFFFANPMEVEVFETEFLANTAAKKAVENKI